MQDYKKLKIWESSHQLTKNLYEITSCFPKEEIYGLTSQVRRAGCSIPTNIAEGCGRNNPADFAHFLQISLGSTFELEYLCFLSFELNYIQDTVYSELSKEITLIKKMLSSLIRQVRNK